MRIESETEGREINYLLCQDEATLIYLANLGCIEINPWFSRVGSLDNPDYLAIDLDPLDIAFDKVIEAALTVHRVMEEAGIPNYCKTSGATGLHIYVPLGAQYTYDQARQFAQVIAYLAHQRLPETTSVERSPDKRRGRVYLDYLQNRRGQTLAAPYCVRPLPGAPVSTPLLWDELKPGLNPTDFSIKTTSARLERIGDVFSPVLGSGVDLRTGLLKL